VNDGAVHKSNRAQKGGGLDHLPDQADFRSILPEDVEAASSTSPAEAERMSGVRASSMKTLSASSTIAKWRPRRTGALSSDAMISLGEYKGLIGQQDHALDFGVRGKRHEKTKAAMAVAAAWRAMIRSRLLRNRGFKVK
jgi:hypothetical protein